MNKYIIDNYKMKYNIISDFKKILIRISLPEYNIKKKRV